jgi:hypothetical protein
MASSMSCAPAGGSSSPSVTWKSEPPPSAAGTSQALCSLSVTDSGSAWTVPGRGLRRRGLRTAAVGIPVADDYNPTFRLFSWRARHTRSGLRQIGTSPHARHDTGPPGSRRRWARSVNHRRTVRTATAPPTNSGTRLAAPRWCNGGAGPHSRCGARSCCDPASRSRPAGCAWSPRAHSSPRCERWYADSSASVPSRFKGEWVRVRIYEDKRAFWQIPDLRR